jgi:hypothetical protein
MMRKSPAAVAVVILTLFAAGAAVFPAGAASTGPTDRMSISNLSHAVVPAYCDMPRQRLHPYKTAPKYHPRQGAINLRHPGYPIVTHLRQQHSDLVASYDCTAGGVGWPQLVMAYSAKGRLLDALYLGHYGHQEHADVTRWRAAGHSVRMHWISYEGAGFFRHRHDSRITLEHGRLVLHPVG